jgi:predicted nuclease of predicted toxin-antitoxin system
LRWLADECVDAGLVTQLRGHGHDVIYVAEDAAGLPDPDVLKHAGEQRRLLLTEDKDFGDLVFRLRKAVPGVILLRIGPDDRRL